MYPFVAICFGMAAMGGAAPALPCKSAQELLKAVEYALTNQDTNYFWKLCYWKDVPAADEPMYKRIWLIHFKQPSDATKEYSGFRLQPLPKDYDVNKPKPRRRGGNEFVGPNLPIIGFIGYKTKGTLADVDIRGRSARYSAGGDIEYSKAPDGTYWLPVNVPVPVGPNKSSSTP
jgi:hypothetical protein